ncbi:SapC family protein [Sulfurospirillum sp. 1307]
MARKIRLFFEDVALLIVVKSLNKEAIFKDEEDYNFYLSLLEKLSSNLHVDIHSYSLSTEYIHLLGMFGQKDSLSRFMQSLNLNYINYYNKKYNRNGTLWEGRYKSSLVEDKFILSVMSYIESFSLRECKIDKQNPFKFTSHSKNAYANYDPIIRENEMYKLLGKDSKDRSLLYKKSFNKFILDKDLMNFIKNNLDKQTLTGSPEFYKKIEERVGDTILKKRGRPKNKKNQKEKEGKDMYNKLVVLDKEKHKSLKVTPLENLNFAKDLKFIPILANEIAMVSEIFPVVFTSDEIPSLVALTSLGKENLAINDEGKYISRYVPAFLRKYPFSLANTKEDSEQKVILIDEEASNVSKSKGKQLFNKEGEQTEVLKNAINFLTDYEKQNLNTQAVIKAIKDSGILEDREISVGEGEEKKVLINGFQVVNKDKLNALDDETLALWVRKGIITFIDKHLESLSKIEILFKLASQNQQTKN